MENLLYIAAIIAAVGFLVLCVSLAITFFSVKKTLANVAVTVEHLDANLQDMTKETALLLHKTNALTEDIQYKSSQLNGLVTSVKGFGDTVNQFNSSMQRITSSVTNEVEKNEDKIAQVVQWSNVVLGIRDQWKERKSLEEAGYYTYKAKQTKKVDPTYQSNL